MIMDKLFAMKGPLRNDRDVQFVGRDEDGAASSVARVAGKTLHGDWSLVIASCRLSRLFK